MFTDTYPGAEITLMGVEESVDPREISVMALTEALFLQRHVAVAT